MWVFVPVIDDPGAHRVFNDITNMLHRIFVFTQYVIVETGLPDLALKAMVPRQPAGETLESLNEVDDVRACGCRLNQQMEMIRHKAIDQDIDFMLVRRELQRIPTRTREVGMIETPHSVSTGNGYGDELIWNFVKATLKSDAFWPATAGIVTHGCISGIHLQLMQVHGSVGSVVMQPEINW